jgi:hypothetical protein
MANIPTTMRLSDLRETVRQRADMVNSQFVTDDELNSYINQSYFELYDILVQKYGDDYFGAPLATFTPNGTQQLYPLPDGVTLFTNGMTGATYAAPAMYKFLGLDLNLSQNQYDSRATIRRFKFSERNRYAVPNFQSFYGVTNLRYRLYGNQLFLTPIPATGQSFNIWYIPRLNQLVNDTDTVDGISGWTEYIIVDAAIKCLQKEESDVSILAQQKAALSYRIEAAAENRDAGEPECVGDTQSSDMWWPTGNGGGYGSGSF